MAFALRKYLLSKPEACEVFPFGPEISVFKVRDKIFAICLEQQDGRERVNLKCDPLEAEQLRMVFRDLVLPGYHMNKRHWNTVVLDDSLPSSEIERMIDNSYALVVKKMGKAVAAQLLP